MWKSASAIGSSASRLTAVSVLKVSSGAKPFSPAVSTPGTSSVSAASGDQASPRAPSTTTKLSSSLPRATIFVVSPVLAYTPSSVSAMTSSSGVVSTARRANQTMTRARITRPPITMPQKPVRKSTIVPNSPGFCAGGVVTGTGCGSAWSSRSTPAVPAATSCSSPAAACSLCSRSSWSLRLAISLSRTSIKAS